ncbi:MAG: TatD family hydrolase [Oscillospiraceae bacterium]
MAEHIFDSHSHYTDSSFDEDRDKLLQDMHKSGVEYIMMASSSCEDSEKALDISRNYDFMFNAVGVHPECVNDTPENYIEILENLAENPKVKAIGEIGLDYHYEEYDRDLQIRMFREQLELAKKLDLPVIIHSRNSSEDTMQILEEYKPNGVVHCFSGSAETAERVIQLGMHISFTGVLTFKNARKALKALERVPMDRLMLETDCPYMAPEPWRGKRCNSLMIESIARKVGEIKNLDMQEVLDITNANARRFFNII